MVTTIYQLYLTIIYTVVASSPLSSIIEASPLLTMKANHCRHISQSQCEFINLLLPVPALLSDEQCQDVPCVIAFTFGGDDGAAGAGGVVVLVEFVVVTVFCLFLLLLLLCLFGYYYCCCSLFSLLSACSGRSRCSLFVSWSLGQSVSWLAHSEAHGRFASSCLRR